MLLEMKASGTFKFIRLQHSAKLSNDTFRLVQLKSPDVYLARR
jgi:hypothetical protein